MRIVLYFINYNDSFYFPFIKRHYEKFCEKIVMYDNHSTDDSVQLAKDLGFEVRTFGGNQLNDQHYLDVKNHCWKECRNQGIHYVIVCDADEFVVPDMNSLSLMEPSAPKVIGYNMISEELPSLSIEEINVGSYSESYSKQAIFSPDKIEEINFVHGCHKNNMTGEITRGGNTKLYHLRMIGGVESMILRHAEYRKRMSLFNKKHRMGFHYEHSDDAKRIEWEELKSKSIQLW